MLYEGPSLRGYWSVRIGRFSRNANESPPSTNVETEGVLSTHILSQASWWKTNLCGFGGSLVVTEPSVAAQHGMT